MRKNLLGTRLGFMVTGSVLAGTAVLVLSIGFVFTLSVSAHDIDVEQAKAKVRAYAREVLNDGRNGYIYSRTSCKAIFKEHNHQVSCRVSYQNENDKNMGEWTCQEDITVFFQAHKGTRRNWEYYLSHVSPQSKCGKRTLIGPIP
jgi:effector-binding domain-containing protein